MYKIILLTLIVISLISFSHGKISIKKHTAGKLLREKSFREKYHDLMSEEFEFGSLVEDDSETSMPSETPTPIDIGDGITPDDETPTPTPTPDVDTPSEEEFRDIPVEEECSNQLAEQKAASQSSVPYHEKYNTYPDIVKFLHDIHAKHPETTKLFSLGKSFEDRDIWAISISRDVNQDKVIANNRIEQLFVGANHAREWLTPAGITWLIEDLLNEDKREDGLENDYLSKFIYTFVPVVNVDGYVFTWTSNEARLWRNTRTVFGEKGYPDCSRGETQDAEVTNPHECVGVNTNRNYPILWRGTDDSEFGQRFAAALRDPCSIQFAGWCPMSEPCMRAVEKYILANKLRIKAYHDFHTSGQGLIAPHTTKQTNKKSDANLYFLFRKIMKGIKEKNGAKYIHLDKHSVVGHSLDWTESLGIRYSESMEGRPNRAKRFRNRAGRRRKVPGFCPPVEAIPLQGEDYRVVLNEFSKFLDEVYIQGYEDGLCSVSSSRHEDKGGVCIQSDIRRVTNRNRHDSKCKAPSGYWTGYCPNTAVCCHPIPEDYTTKHDIIYEAPSLEDLIKEKGNGVGDFDF